MVLDYVNSLIYKMVSALDDKIYVGSTRGTLRLRKSKHKSASKIKPNRRVYEHLNRVGWSNVRIVLIESFPCNNRDELIRREQYYIDLLKPELNKNSSYVHCPHGRNHNTCIPCNGSAICEHIKQKSQCIICDGTSICEHKRLKSQCIQCGGSKICEHNHQKNQCKLCNADKYKCDYCCKSYSSKHVLKKHYTSMLHKLKFINEFEKVFNEVITMLEATEMDFQ
jgi:hypothetical protein